MTSHYWGRTLRSAVVMVLDAVWIAAAFFLALWLRFEFRIDAIPAAYFSTYRATIVWWALACVAVKALMGAYNCIWRYVGIRDLQRLLYAHGAMMVVGLLAVVLGNGTMPRSYYCMGYVFSVVGSIALHVSYRIVLQIYAELFSCHP